MKLWRIASTVLLACSIAATLSAQTSRGTVTGLVTDPQRAVIVGAQVELQSKETGQVRTATTNQAGIYRFDAVDLGEYGLKITASGFRPFVQKGIGIQANRIATLDAQLEIGTGTVVVEVNALAEQILQSSDSVRGGNFSRQEVTKLPLGALNPIALARLLPGVTQPTGGTTFGNGGQQTNFAVNGQRPRGNNYLLDGVENNDISVGGPAFTISDIDAVAEFSAQTALFSAEFGRAGGGVFNVITRSGTNDFHGTARELFFSQAFNALTNGQRVSGLTRKPVFTENVYGGTFGGPIVKNKTFFFGSLQWDPFRSSANSSAFTVPTAAGLARLRQLFPAANPRVDLYLKAFEGLEGLTNITNVALGRDPATGVDRGNIEFGRRGIPYSNRSDEHQWLVRVDHSFNENQRLAVRYAFNDSITTPNGVDGAGFFSDFNGRDQNALVTHTWVLSPFWTNELRLSYGRISFMFPVSPSSKELAKTQPNVSISGLSGFGIATNIPQFRIANNYLVQETMTRVVGTHQLRFGAEFLRQLAAQHPPFNERGSFSFLAGGGYTAFANYIDNYSGFRGTAGINFGDPIYYPNLFRHSYFFQDTWKTRPSLTLTLGLRYENFGQPANSAFKYPAFAGFDPAQFLVPNKVNSDNNNFGPVLGFAWTPLMKSGLGRLFGTGKTVWRGGYQVSYDTFFNNLLSNIAADSPNTINTLNTETSAGTSATSRGTLGWYPNAIPATARPVSPADSQTSVFNKNVRNPYTQRFSFGFQRQLPAGMVLDLSYVGSLSRKLFVSEDLNPLVGTQRLYPSLGIRRWRSSGASSSYNALQVRGDRRFSHGLRMNTSYTYSKFIDNTSEVFATASSNNSLASVPVNRGGLVLDRGPSDWDRTHRLAIAYVWEIPGFKRGLLGHVLGGWEMSGITTFQSGVPFTFVNGSDRDGDGLSGSDRPDIGNPNAPRNTRAIISSSSPTGYLNPDTSAPVSPNDVFLVEGRGFPGAAAIGRNTERSRRVTNFDWSLFKNFRITERFKLEYRLETFNIFNHPQFTGVPNRTVNGTTAGSFLNFNLLNGGGRTMRMGLRLTF